MKLKKETIEQIRDSSSEGEFWRSDTEKHLQDMIKSLVKSGVKESEACDLILSAFGLGQAEYGG